MTNHLREVDVEPLTFAVALLVAEGTQSTILRKWPTPQLIWSRPPEEQGTVRTGATTSSSAFSDTTISIVIVYRGSNAPRPRPAGEGDKSEAEADSSRASRLRLCKSRVSGKFCRRVDSRLR